MPPRSEGRRRSGEIDEKWTRRGVKTDAPPCCQFNSLLLLHPQSHTHHGTTLDSGPLPSLARLQCYCCLVAWHGMAWHAPLPLVRCRSTTTTQCCTLLSRTLTQKGPQAAANGPAPVPACVGSHSASGQPGTPPARRLLASYELPRRLAAARRPRSRGRASHPPAPCPPGNEPPAALISSSSCADGTGQAARMRLRLCGARTGRHGHGHGTARAMRTRLL